MSKSVEIENLDLQAQNVLLPMGLRVSTIAVKGQSAVIDLSAKALVGGSVTLVATVTEQPLAEFVQSKVPPQVKDVQVYLGDGLIKLSAKAVILLPISFTAYCKLEIVNETELHLRLVDVQPGGPVLSFLEKEVAEMNPILSASDLPVAVKLTGVTIEDGAINLTGGL